MNKKKMNVNTEGMKKISLGIVILIIVVWIAYNSITVIPTGYTGVKTTFGQISDATVPNGFNLKIPFVQSIQSVNNKQQDIVFDDKIWSETSERTVVYFTGITVTYQINPEKSAWIYANVSDYNSNLVSSDLVASAIKSSSKTLSSVDVTNRALLEPLALESITASLNDKYGEDVITVNKVVIRDIDFEESYNTKIAEKQNAQLEYEKQQIENQKTIEMAEADAEAVLISAEAEAQVKEIEAQAVANSNKLIADSLSNNIFIQNWIEKWDGKLPTVTGGSESFFNVSDLITQDIEQNTQTETQADTQNQDASGEE